MIWSIRKYQDDSVTSARRVRKGFPFQHTILSPESLSGDPGILWGLDLESPAA